MKECHRTELVKLCEQTDSSCTATDKHSRKKDSFCFHERATCTSINSKQIRYTRRCAQTGDVDTHTSLAPERSMQVIATAHLVLRTCSGFENQVTSRPAPLPPPHCLVCAPGRVLPHLTSLQLTLLGYRPQRESVRKTHDDTSAGKAAYAPKAPAVEYEIPLEQLGHH